jgi:hypothetical protein
MRRAERDDKADPIVSSYRGSGDEFVIDEALGLLTRNMGKLKLATMRRL